MFHIGGVDLVNRDICIIRPESVRNILENVYCDTIKYGLVQFRNLFRLISQLLNDNMCMGVTRNQLII